MRARAAPCPGVLGPARTAPPPLRARGGVLSPSPSPPEPFALPLRCAIHSRSCANGCAPLPCARSSPPRLYPASLACTRGHFGTVTDSARTLLHSRLGVSGRAGGGSASCTPVCERGGSGRGAARNPGESGDWPGQGRLWGLTVPPLLPLEGQGERHGNAGRAKRARVGPVKR